MRKRLITLIHIGKAELGWSDDVYRDVLYRLTGAESASACGVPQLEKVVAYMKEQGFVPAPKASASADHGRRPSVNAGRVKTLSKIEALITAAGRPWSYVEGMAERMFNQKVIEWLDDAQLTKIMQALIYDAKRRERVK